MPARPVGPLDPEKAKVKEPAPKEKKSELSPHHLRLKEEFLKNYTPKPTPEEQLKQDRLSAIRKTPTPFIKHGERGPIKVQRRREPPPGEEFQQAILPTRTSGRFHDWRDYEPGRYGGRDPYAHCVYPKEQERLDTPDYQAMPAICKLELMWQLALKDERRERFYTGFEFRKFFEQDMNLTYDVVTDTMPVNRLKKTHPVGLTAKIEFISSGDHPYTGMFRGSEHALMRISDTTKTTPEVPKTAPGFGLKFLRDGMSSANILAMFSFDGQKSFNFFKNRWVTILREF